MSTKTQNVPIRTFGTDSSEWIVYTVVNEVRVLKDGPYSDREWAVNRAKNIVQDLVCKNLDIEYEMHVVPYVKRPA